MDSEARLKPGIEISQANETLEALSEEFEGTVTLGSKSPNNKTQKPRSNFDTSDEHNTGKKTKLYKESKKTQRSIDRSR